MKPRLVVMLKEPRPGRVKTRLGREIGMVAAAWWFRHQVRRVLRRLDDPRWDMVLAVSPDREGCASRIWPRYLRRIPQGRGDLGDRMTRALKSCRTRPVCVVGADIPGVSRQGIARAFRALGRADAVFGPARDGGYWLIGFRHTRALPAGLFNGVRWSSEHALGDTRATIRDLTVAFVDELQDVDTAQDFHMTTAGTHGTPEV